MGHPMSWPDAAAIMDEIARLTPIYGGIAYDRLEGIGLQWPCPSRAHTGTPILHTEQFTRGRGKFHPVRFLPARELPDAEYPFVLTTGRILQHWHTGTMTRRSEILDALVPHGALELNPEDARGLGLAPGGMAVVRSRRGKIEVPVDITERVDRGTVFLAFHFKEHPANALTIAALDPVAKIPEYKVCAVRISRD
jgi:predicted molibdopterin-dependent oxidoreductase YjgC